MKKYTVEFENSYGETREIGHANTSIEVLEVINKFLEDRNFKSYYIRMWDRDDKTVMDFGSHTEFLYVYPKLEN